MALCWAICDDGSCPNEARAPGAKGLCPKHYSRLRRYGDPTIVHVRGWRGGTEEDYFWSKVKKSDSCWTWTGATDKYGYGYFGIKSPEGQWRTIAAHRWSYIQATGNIPEDDLDHLCVNPSCVNPAHLEDVPHSINISRSNGVSARNTRKTHCVRNHEFTEENTIFTGKGRRCKKCLSGKISGVHREKALKIAERDNWICGICEEPIDSTLRVPDSYSLSVDHIVPSIDGGDNHPSNLRASHLFCNVSRGGKLGAQRSLLVQKEVG